MNSGMIQLNNLPTLPYAMEEAMNRLRVNVSFLGKDVRKIMIISSLPNEGKSFVALQLWRQTAEAGVPCVFLDADLRKSVIAEKYGLKLDKSKKIRGTSHYLSENTPVEDAIFHTNIENGDMLPNIDNVVNPSMLVENERFGELLDYMSDNYRYTFIDCPPLDLVSDGEKIGSMCDGAILVVRGGKTDRKLVRSSVRQLERAGCPLLGIVLNRVESGKGDYYNKRYYGKYGSYGKDGYYYKTKEAK